MRLFATARPSLQFELRAQGEVFQAHNKILFYRRVLAMLGEKGFS